MLDEETSELLFTSARLDNGEPFGYGVGWRLEFDENGLTEIWHGGAGRTSRNLVLRGMKSQITVAYFARESLKFTRDLRKVIVDELCDCVRRMDWRSGKALSIKGRDCRVT